MLPVKLGDDVVPERTVDRVVGLRPASTSSSSWSDTVVVALLGAGLPESVGAAASMMGNMGPAFGDAGPASNFLVFSRPARGVLMVMMLAGRLEIFPIVFLLTRLAAPGRRLRAGARRTTRRIVDVSAEAVRGPG